MERSRITRYVRIAVTALSLTACVLLIALWVRSQGKWDHIRGSISNHNKLAFNSACGKLSISHSQFPRWHEWRRYSFALVDLQSHEIPSGIRSAKFGFALNKDRHRLVMPYWFLILLTAIFTAAPWIHWSKRFSLRTLLIATTLVALGLTVIVLLR